MGDIAARVRDLGKRYRIGEVEQYKTLRDTITGALQAPFRWWRNGARATSQGDLYVWALKNVSFDVQCGEVVGIIGRNGAGKSTLLKILSRITEPTTGQAEIFGRVGSLLEVGTGFHPELTGRENIFLNGAILGMKHAEIACKFDEIVAFAEVERFIDTPVKHYSSGMQMRLAFGVAAHLEPEILLVDEVLAVGDVGFQKKCLGKMKEVGRHGRTVLFVSHNMGAISTLCERAIVLSGGSVVFIGPAREAVTYYLAGFRTIVDIERQWSFEEAPGGDNVRLKSARITDGRGIARSYYSTTESIVVSLEYWVLRDGAPVNAYIGVFDENDTLICVVGNHLETRDKPIRACGLYVSRCTIPAHLLNAGTHTLEVYLVTNLSDLQAQSERCLAFTVVDDQRVHSGYSRWAGIIKPEFEWQTELVERGTMVQWSQ